MHCTANPKGCGVTCAACFTSAARFSISASRWGRWDGPGDCAGLWRRGAKDSSTIGLKGQIEIVPVRWIDEVLERALETRPVPLSEEAPAAPPPAAPAPAGETLVVKH